jgi:hypothetical protein
MLLGNGCRMEGLEASTEEKKMYGPPNFWQRCLRVTYQTGTRFTKRRKRKEWAWTRTTFPSGEDIQLRVGRRKGKKVRGGEKSCLWAIGGEWRFGYIQASHSHFPRCQRVLPLSIIKTCPRAQYRNHTLPCFCYHTA